MTPATAVDLAAWPSSFGTALAPLGAAILSALVLLLALAIDRRLGEPPLPIHPVVWMGHYLKVCGWLAVRLQPALAFVAGALAWCVGALAAGAVAWGVQALAFSQLSAFLAAPALTTAGNTILFFLLMAWLLKCMLSWRMLHDEAGAVEAALQRSLTDGRERLSRLVSRDTTKLDETEVRESTIESLAENLNDSVVAPIFWFVLFGLPGAAVYRFANTADAMWGYCGLRDGVDWEWAGKWAARADDVLSWFPARLTALLLALVAGGLRPHALRVEAHKTPSPNSGWPMAAMALALDVSLRKPGVYVLNPNARAVQPADLVLAQSYALKVLVASVLFAELAIFSIALVGWL